MVTSLSKKFINNINLITFSSKKLKKPFWFNSTFDSINQTENFVFAPGKQLNNEGFNRCRRKFVYKIYLSRIMVVFLVFRQMNTLKVQIKIC